MAISFEWFAVISNIVFIINIGLAAVMLFFERKKPESLWSWLLLLFLLPVAGFVLYFLFGQPFKKYKLLHSAPYFHPALQQLAAKQQRDLQSGPVAFENKAAEAFQDVIQMNVKSDEAPFSENNSIQVFKDGPEKWTALLQDIDKAQHYIHVEYYEITNDKTSKHFVQKLAEKARQNVEVLFLYDDVGSKKLPRDFFKDLHDAGGKTAAFLPTRLPFHSSHVNYRNHRKVVVIDGLAGYIGGLNIGDKYMGKSKKFGYWRDTHIRIIGDAVHSLQHRFLLDWNHTAAFYPIHDAAAYFPPAAPGKENTAVVQVVSSGPGEPLNNVKNGFLKLISRAQKTVYLQTPYFIPDESALDVLKIAALGGTDVRIMIPNKPDHPFVHAATLSFVRELLNAGVKVYIYEKGFLHAKTLVVDNQAFTVGSTNMDRRSFSLNFEANAFLFDEQLGEKLAKMFFNDMEDSKEITLDFFKRQSLYQRFKQLAGRLLAPLL